MYKYAGILLLLLIGIGPQNAAAQSAKADTLATSRFKLAFGPYKAGMTPLAEDWKKVVAQELKVTDPSGTAWTVVTYRLGWRRKDFSDDVRTGRRKMVYLYNAREVDGSSRIPTDWQKEMQEFVQPSEEISFEAIIVQHPKTRKMMQASTLLFKLK